MIESTTFITAEIDNLLLIKELPKPATETSKTSNGIVHSWQ